MCIEKPIIGVLEFLFNTIHGGDGLDPYAERPKLVQENVFKKESLRIGYLVDEHFFDFDSAIPAAIEQVCASLPQMNMQVETKKTRLFSEGLMIAKQLFQADAGQSLRNLLCQLGTTELSRPLQAWLASQPKEPLSLEQYSSLWINWDEYKIKFLELFQNYDLLIAPVSPQCALAHGESLKPDFVWSLIRYTASITLTECPVVVMPCGFNQYQLPIGMQIIAKPWKDKLVLALAKKIEQLLH